MPIFFLINVKYIIKINNNAKNAALDAVITIIKTMEDVPKILKIILSLQRKNGKEINMHTARSFVFHRNPVGAPKLYMLNGKLISSKSLDSFPKNRFMSDFVVGECPEYIFGKLRSFSKNFEKQYSQSLLNPFDNKRGWLALSTVNMAD